MVYRVLLQGGLGNQLFQVAAGTFLSENLGKKVIFDATLLTRIPKKIRLRNIEVQWLIEKANFDKHSVTTVGRLFADKYSEKLILKEKNLNDRILDRLTKKAKILNGYFHNYEYVDKSWTKLGPKILNRINQNSRRNSSTSKYIAVHFRGGDYLTNNLIRQAHGVTGLNYFINGVKKLTEDLNTDNVVFVTDSPEFLREKIEIFQNLRTSIVSSENIYEDLALIANSSGVVMSNSTFSWWGAFIANKISDAKIIVPTPWFTGIIEEPQYLIPNHWTVLERDIF